MLRAMRRRAMCRTAVARALSALAGASASLACAQSLQCHVGWAGASRVLVVAPTPADEPALPLLEGANLSLEVINRLPPAPGAGVTVRTLGRWQGQPYLLHEAHYLPSAPAVGPHGFTGLQTVREPTRGHLLTYWCEHAPAVAAR
ncbi:hypothetical protein Talka_01906 [Tepidimonas alkaliphilus]|uniref:Uncharacterized protein n=1 Tax=Tepidimonas alkaliphilus TaxID=2588942 RepID=A0A554W5M2_9BURK|nr:hypothetical protein [Tepidimonas alkaliphilus]TSE18876.1 hypothetical protein Talka_01906 [Tepidimonas alkaliphilus]